jgi:hypothetical protein
MKINVKLGRLALRVEGKNWTAYYAMPDTLDGAIYLGSINMRFVQSKKRKQIFMDLMLEAVGDILEEIIGERPTWPDGPQPAPEHERSGNS